MPFSKGRVIHKTKSSATKIVSKCKQENIPCKITKLKKGYRVDKDWS